jgi:methionyl-tRNA formyltransferase
MTIKILSTNIMVHEPGEEREPGMVILPNNGKLFVACGPDGKDTLEIHEVKPANRGKMTAISWANGVRLKPGTVLRMQ